MPALRIKRFPVRASPAHFQKYAETLFPKINCYLTMLVSFSVVLTNPPKNLCYNTMFRLTVSIICSRKGVSRQRILYLRRKTMGLLSPAGFLKRLVKRYARGGIRVECVQTDNGFKSLPTTYRRVPPSGFPLSNSLSNLFDSLTANLSSFWDGNLLSFKRQQVFSVL